MEVSVNKEGNKATISIPALSYTDFDRTGKVNVRNVQSLLTIARWVAYHTPNQETGSSFLEYDKVTTDTFTFMASTVTQFNQSLYDLTRHSTQPSFAVDLSLGYVGGASLNSVAKLYCRETGHVYAENTNQVVMVDKGTRKPTLIPKWWTEKYSKCVQGQGQSLIIGRIRVPDLTHNYELKVAWTDMDSYKHTNYVSYIRFCLDAAMDAAHAGFFTRVTGDFLTYRINKMEISYRGESVANDVLTVNVWENEENPFVIHFTIMKDVTLIFQNTFTLFEPK